MVRRRLITSVVVVAVAVTTVLVLRSGGSSPQRKRPTVTPTASGHVLRFLSENRYASLDPAFLTTPRERDVGRLLYRTLMTYGPDGRSLVPDLAGAAGIPSQDKKTWTYRLRPDVRYDNGDTVTATDVVRGLRRAQAQGSVPLSLITDVQAREPSIVVLRFAKPFVDADSLAALTATAPVPAKGPRATGPYKVASERSGVSFRLVRNGFGPPAGPDEVVAELGLTGAVIDRRIAASTGEDAYAVTDKAVLEGPQDKRVIRGPDGSVQLTVMNLRRGPFTDIKVRQALEVAYPLAAVRTAAGGAAVGSAATHVLPPPFPTLKDFDPYDLRDRDGAGDPGRARRMLTAAGYPDGVGITAAVPRTDTGQAVAAALTAALAPAGFRLTVTTVPVASYYSTVGVPSRQPDLVAYAWAPDWPTPSAVIPPLFTCEALTPTANHNVANHCDRGFDLQVEAALAEGDEEERDAMWEALDRRLVEEAVVVPRSFGVSACLVGTRVHDARSALAFGGAVDLLRVTLR